MPTKELIQAVDSYWEWTEGKDPSEVSAIEKLRWDFRRIIPTFIKRRATGLAGWEHVHLFSKKPEHPADYALWSIGEDLPFKPECVLELSEDGFRWLGDIFDQKEVHDWSDELRSLNSRIKNHDSATDILGRMKTFPMMSSEQP